MTITVASLAPSRLDVHGDAKNAEVLAQRVRWAGADAVVVDVSGGDAARRVRPDAVTIGSGFDADASDVLDALRDMQREVHAWVADGVPLLAVGLGWELLASTTELDPGSPFPGLGVFPGRFHAAERSVGQLAVRSEAGLLVGYEYHLRDYHLSGAERPLGAVVRGIGNVAATAGARFEGARVGSCFGTAMRGPVLARNPRLAEAMLVLAFRRRGEPFVPSAAREQRDADAAAARANAAVAAALGIVG